MSYSVFRVQGIKTTGDLKGISKHNKDRVSHTNKDIDKEKSKDNIILVECSNYTQKFNQIVEPMKVEHAERMKTMRADRVKTFEQHINSSKNDVACEMIFTSDNEFFEGMKKEDIKKWAEESLNFVIKDVGIKKENIIHAIVHMDEKTPHLHVVAVPLVKTYNKKQNKDVWSISRRQFINGKNQLSQAQDQYNKRMNDSGYKLERGEKGSDKVHTTKEEYEKIVKLEKLEKETKEVENKKEELKGDISLLSKRFKLIEERVDTYKRVDTNIKSIDKLEVKKSILGSSVSLNKSDYENLMLLAKQGIYNTEKVEMLERQNKELKIKSQKLYEENLELKKKDQVSVKQIDNYKVKIKNMNRALGYVGEDIRESILKKYEEFKNPPKNDNKKMRKIDKGIER